MILINGISDNWFDCCFYVDNKAMNSISSSFNFLFHYDNLITVVFIILILFPILFKLYAFRTQQRLRIFYDQARTSFLNFIFLCSLSLSVCAILHLVIKQPAPCFIWNGLSAEPLKESSRTPNENMIMILIACNFVIFAKFGNLIIKFAFALILLVLFSAFSVSSGESSISQIFISFFVGIWIFFIHKFVSPAENVVISTIIVICVFTVYGVNYPSDDWESSLVRHSLHLVFKGAFALIIYVYLQIRFGFNRKDFDWFKRDWVLNEHTWARSATADAIIPSMAKDSPNDDFGKTLSNDLFDGIIVFLFYLIGNLIQYYLDNGFYFMFE